MSTAAEFARHRPHAEDARLDEQYVRVLFVEDQGALAEEVHKILGRCRRGSFDVVRETDLVKAAAQIRGERFDLLLLDLSLSNLERSSAIDLANELAHRLPVVVLTGTEALDELGDGGREQIAHCLEHADVPGKLLGAIRRSRRLGTAVMTPTFCRIAELCD